MDPQPLDTAKVKLPCRCWETRTALSATMDDKVTDDFNKHMDEKYNGEDKPKTKAQKKMTPDQRDKIIQEMFARSGLTVGVGHISKDHVNRVEQANDQVHIPEVRHSSHTEAENNKITGKKLDNKTPRNDRRGLENHPSGRTHYE